MKKIIFLVLLLISIPSVSAYTFLNIYIDNTGEAEFAGETDSNISLPEGIFLDEGLIYGETYELTNKKGKIWSFSYSLEDSEFYVILPKEAIIHNISNGEVYIEDKQFSIYSKGDIKIKYSLSEKNDKDYHLFLLLIPAIIIGLLIFFIKKKEPKSKDNKLDILKQVLNKRERIIIDKLKETGKIKGSYLRRACKIPKASFYRHINELEKKGIIKKSGTGRNKTIELIK